MPDPDNSITQQLADISDRIARICETSGRAPGSVKLLAVSKTRSADDVRTALGAGQINFGENYLQEAIDKVDSIPEATWHFIGGIQSNKTRDIANRFDWVHSVSSQKVARRLAAQRQVERGKLNVLVQINLSEEPQKGGIAPAQAIDFVGELRALDTLRLSGLMAIPASTGDLKTQHSNFARLRALKDQIASELALKDFTELSMGMTQDYEAAIAEGATWIRIGTAIFGARAPKSRGV